MAFCTVHPHVQTDEVCSACARAFCAACLVNFMGGRYCGPCRDLQLARVQGLTPEPPTGRLPTMADQIIPAKNPMALTGYYLGIFSLVPCLGNLLGPAAVILGALGLKARRENPLLPGKAHALVAVILGSLTSLLYWGFAGLIILGIATSGR